VDYARNFKHGFREKKTRIHVYFVLRRLSNPKADAAGDEADAAGDEANAAAAFSRRYDFSFSVTSRCC
jgi:hypothetical protein